MSFWKKIKKEAASTFKSPLKSALVGGLLGGGGGAVSAGATSAVAGAKLSDILMGKKSDTINPDDIANQIRATQSKGIGELNAALDNKNAAQIVGAGAERAKMGILTSAQDARRNAQQGMARMGLKGSSLGLGLNRSIDQEAGNSIAGINAALPGQLRSQELADAQTRINVGGVNQNGMNFNTIEGARSGGIMGMLSAVAPLAGQAAGAYKDYQTGSLASRR